MLATILTFSISMALAQGYVTLPESMDVKYDVPAMNQSLSMDSLFCELRKAEFRVPIGEGEASMEKRLQGKWRTNSYGVIVFHDLNQIIVRLYVSLPVDKRNALYEAVQKDYYECIRLRREKIILNNQQMF